VKIYANFDEGTVCYDQKRMPVVEHTLGIIKQDLLEIGADTGTSITVQARKMNDTPKIAPKGDVMVVSDAWYLYMRKLMTDAAWHWWGITPRMLMINRESKWFDEASTEMPKFECIALPCNFIATDYFINDFAHVLSRDSQHFDVSKLDPQKDNWYYYPWLFWKATAHNDNGDVWLVGKSLHVYTPVIREEPDVYIQKNFVEWFPPLPMNVTYQGHVYRITGYCVQGASVYGHADAFDVPLRLARAPGECIHPCPEWSLKEKPVPPEVRPEWV